MFRRNGIVRQRNMQRRVPDPYYEDEYLDSMAYNYRRPNLFQRLRYFVSGLKANFEDEDDYAEIEPMYSNKVLSQGQYNPRTGNIMPISPHGPTRTQYRQMREKEIEREKAAQTSTSVAIKKTANSLAKKAADKVVAMGKKVATAGLDQASSVLEKHIVNPAKQEQPLTANANLLVKSSDKSRSSLPTDIAQTIAEKANTVMKKASSKMKEEVIFGFMDGTEDSDVVEINLDDFTSDQGVETMEIGVIYHAIIHSSVLLDFVDRKATKQTFTAEEIRKGKRIDLAKTEHTEGLRFSIAPIKIKTNLGELFNTVGCYKQSGIGHFAELQIKAALSGEELNQLKYVDMTCQQLYIRATNKNPIHLLLTVKQYPKLTEKVKITEYADDNYYEEF